MGAADGRCFGAGHHTSVMCSGQAIVNGKVLCDSYN